MTTRDLVVTRTGARFAGRALPCTLGRGGIVDGRAKREGDGATPRGTHRFVGLLYRADRIGRAQMPDWARPIGPGDLWSDDPRDPLYNQYLPRAWAHRYSTERLARADPMYDVVLLTDWNWPLAHRGAGSAIFVHAMRGPGQPTAGCIGLRAADLRWLVARLRVQDRLVIH